MIRALELANLLAASRTSGLPRRAYSALTACGPQNSGVVARQLIVQDDAMQLCPQDGHRREDEVGMSNEALDGAKTRICSVQAAGEKLELSAGFGHVDE